MEVITEYEILKVELQSQIDIFKNKWVPIFENEYNGSREKLYNERLSDIIKDVMPIWELSIKINGMEVRDNLLNVKDIK